MRHARAALPLTIFEESLCVPLISTAFAGIVDVNGAEARLLAISRLRAWATTFGLLFCLFFAAGVLASAQLNNPPSTYPGESVDGTLRRLAEKDLLLQTSEGQVLRFRLLAKTEFRARDGKPVRDSLVHPGDGVGVYVDPDDVETALYVILVKPGNASAREAASVPVEEAHIVAPDLSDFGKTAPDKSAPPNFGDPLARVLTANNPAVPVPVVKRRVEPEYSPEARAAGLQGTVMLSVEVTPDGTVGSVRVRRGLALGLDERAVAAVKQWRYEPFTANGRSMMDAVEIQFQFDPVGPWQIAGSLLSVGTGLGPVVGLAVKPVLNRYTSPDAGACTKEPVYVPVALTIGKDGEPTNVRVGATIGDSIGKAAIEAAQLWRFRPGTVGGKPEIGSGTILLECGAPEIAGGASGSISRAGAGVSQPAVIFKVDPGILGRSAQSQAQRGGDARGCGRYRGPREGYPRGQEPRQRP
jgi:TonB family protein